MLIIVAFIILVFDPFMIYNVGFLYSFLISFSIMFLSKKITGNYFMKIFKRIIAYLIDIVLVISISTLISNNSYINKDYNKK